MSTFKIENARLSFPSLWQSSAFGDSTNLKYSATFIVDKEQQAELITAMKKAGKELAKEKWGEKLPKKLWSALQDGDESDRAEYETSMIVKANNKKRVPVVDKDLSALVEEDGRPQAGDYVNAKVRFYAYSDGTAFNGILCSLEAVQFVREGERFGGGGNALEGFDDISSEAAEDVFEEAEDLLA
ncbi:MAG: hypothetical protein CMO61_00060 [Verrucomicrobiales bacterium]|nr:hypothetical protein [Verrucomicrobiales bacterium]